MNNKESKNFEHIATQESNKEFNDFLLTEKSKKEIKEKLAAILPDFPIHGDVNLVFLTDTASVPFGWAAKEYFEQKKNALKLTEKKMPKFLRIDVSPIKNEKQFIKQYFSAHNDEIKKQILNRTLPESIAAIPFAENLMTKLEKQIKNYCDPKQKTTITLFDETLPLKVAKCNAYNQLDILPLTIPLAKFFLNKALQKQGLSPEFYYAGVNMTVPAPPWKSGFNLIKERFNPKIPPMTPIAPVGRYTKYIDKKGDDYYLYAGLAHKKAAMIPLQYQKYAKTLIKEMRDIGKELAQRD